VTLSEALKSGTEKVGRRDAMLLLSYITGNDESWIMIHGDEAIKPSHYTMYLADLERYYNGEPMQYILGKWAFMGIEFNVDKRALIPRSETELLVEEALKFIQYSQKPLINVLDICTGTGCIALSIACLTEAKTTKITAVDISSDALSLAKENAEKLNIPPSHVKFIKSDLADVIINQKFDVIISNPPYILHEDIATLSQTVRDFEPHLALDGGKDGMDIYRRLIPQSFELLNNGGMLLLEIGPVAVVNLMADFKEIKIIQDYAGLERIVTGVKI